MAHANRRLFQLLLVLVGIAPLAVFGIALSATTTSLANGKVSTVSSPTPTPTTLDAYMKSHGKKYYGICITSLQADSKAYGALTPVNSAKWDAIEPSRGSFNFGSFDTFVNYAQSNGKLIRGHTFVWHSQLPSWVSSISNATVLTTVIQNHISTIAKRYAGKVYAWDVVNEIFNEDGTYRSSVFSHVLGSDFVPIAFKAARAADPYSKLYINDYNLDSVTGSASKTNAVINLVKAQVAAGTPIDGIGTEYHISAGGTSTSTIQAALTQLASTGVDVAITELDIQSGTSSDIQKVIQACLAVPKCIGITQCPTERGGWTSIITLRSL